ncbi:hypothetical protein D3C80_1873610 [compost metagenome]
MDAQLIGPHFAHVLQIKVDRVVVAGKGGPLFSIAQGVVEDHTYACPITNAALAPPKPKLRFKMFCNRAGRCPSLT